MSLTLPEVDELTRLLLTPDPVFEAWRERIPDKCWVKYDLSAIRIGFELGKAAAALRDAHVEQCPGLEAAARWVDKRREDFDAENSVIDPDTGTVEYGTGAHARAKEEYSAELVEIAEGIRAIDIPASLRDVGVTPSAPSVRFRPVSDEDLDAALVVYRNGLREPILTVLKEILETLLPHGMPVRMGVRSE